MRKETVYSLFVGLLLTGFTVACQSNEVAGDAGSQATKQPAPSAKPTAAIDIQYEVVGEPTAGQPVLVRLLVTPGAGVSGLHLQIIPDAGLGVDSNSSNFSIGYDAGPEPTVYDVWVTPVTAGQHYLTVLATVDVGGRQQSRTIAIPLQVAARS
jgi:hypothetical protein